MNKQIHISKQVDEALASIDDIPRAEPNPFFFTRLQARISRQESNFWVRATGIMTRPAIAAFGVMAILMINTAVIINKASASTEVPEHAEMAIADEYNKTIAYYAIENAQP